MMVTNGETQARNKSIVIIGAGPAGLTAAYHLCEAGLNVDVFEADTQYVGGISRTVQYKGFYFDIGGHRFFSKFKEIEDFWVRLLGDDLLHRPLLSRIYYRGRFFSYPLKPFEALWNLGIGESLLCVLSYLKAKISPIRPARSLEDWVSNQFGPRLYQIFFKSYTEKVWGISCTELSADWAAQRIKGLSLGTAIKNAILPKPRTQDRSKVVTTLIDSFRYPRLGPGMMWDKCASGVRKMGGRISLGSVVEKCRYDETRGKWQVRVRDHRGETSELWADDVISSAPMRQLAHLLEPELPAAVMEAAEGLRYRDFLTVAVIARDRRSLPDNWIYIHDPSVRVGRMQNFKAWSPEMVPDASLCCYGLEYFCNEGDETWTTRDPDLLELAKRELNRLGLLDPADVRDGCVVRQPKAYPVYDDRYKKNVETVVSDLRSRYRNLHLVGRNGMHRYNSMDHSMITGMLAARNIVAGSEVYDLWKVNRDEEYAETGVAGGELAFEQFTASKQDEPRVGAPEAD